MNKLLTKIVGLSLGLSMAIGVGVAASYSEKDAVRADASQTISTTPAESVSTGKKYVIGATISSTTYYLTSTVTSNWGIRTDNGNNALVFTANGSGTSNFSLYYTENDTNHYLTPKTGTSNTFLQYGTTEKTIQLKNKEVYTNANNYYNLRLNGTSGFRWYGTNSAAGTTGSASFLYEVSESSTPTLSVDTSMNAKIGSNSITVSYSDFSSAPTISASSDTVGVATVTSSVVGSGGKATFTITGVSEGTATITFSATGASSVQTVVTVYEQQQFTKLFKTGKIVSGSKVLIARNNSSTIMSNTQGTSNKNRGLTTAIPAGESDYSTLTTQNALAGIFTITAGTGEYSDYYLLYDTDNAGYLEWYSEKLTTYNKVAAACYWQIVIDSNGVATITNYSASSYAIKHNNSGLFYCYTNGQNDIALYELSSDVPGDVNLSSISASDASVQIGSTITYSGTYLPVNATESIDITLSDSYATHGEVIMSNGTFTVEITGVSETSGTTLSFAGADGHGSASVTLAVTSYTATHTKLTNTSSLYNGMKVILGNSESGLVGTVHAGGNNMPTAAGSFSSDGSTLSNASGSGCEYTMWQVTLKDSEENNVTGWAFYDNGYYLTCGTGTSNHWKQTLELTSLCLFNIAFTDGTTSIVAADTHVQRGTIALNGTIISAYGSLGSYGVIDLYVKESSSDAAIMSGFEDFFLLIDVDLTSHGYCTSKHWYEYAKDAYNNTLTPAQKALITSAASARLSAWAAANGDSLSNGSLSSKASNGLLMLGDETTAITIIVIIAAISVTSIGAFFALRKRKENI